MACHVVRTIDCARFDFAKSVGGSPDSGDLRSGGLTALNALRLGHTMHTRQAESVLVFGVQLRGLHSGESPTEGLNPFGGTEWPFHRGRVSDSLHVRYFHYDS